MERIKMIWDFRGPNAEKIAAHHMIHLNEFAESEKIKNVICKTESLSEMHHIAVMIVEKEYVNDLRERLKPNRGQLYTEE